jgi:hypothetical protein
MGTSRKPIRDANFTSERRHVRTSKRRGAGGGEKYLVGRRCPLFLVSVASKELASPTRRWRGAGVFALWFPDKRLRISSKSFPYHLKWLLLGHEASPKPFVAAFTIVYSRWLSHTDGPNRRRALTDQSGALRIRRHARSGKEPREELSCQQDQRVRNRIRLHRVVFAAVSKHYSSFLEEQRNAVWGAVQTWQRPSC